MKYQENQNLFMKKKMVKNMLLTLPIKNKRVGIPRAISEGQNVLKFIN